MTTRTTLTADDKRRIAERAMHDGSFANHFRSAPRACIAHEIGVDVPESTAIVVVENTATRIHIIVPVGADRPDIDALGVPTGIAVTVLEDDDATVHLALPAPQAESAEISDEELESVAGGAVTLITTVTGPIFVSVVATTIIYTSQPSEPSGGSGEGGKKKKKKKKAF